MPAVILFIGKAESGKTTLLEKIIAELTERGYNVATIKHTFHNIDPDVHGKDTWRHIDAGCKTTTLVANNNIILFKPIKEPANVDDIIKLYGEDNDIILIEGFKHSNFPKIEIHRKAIGPILSDIDNIVAYASDEVLDTQLEQFNINDSKGISDFIEKNYLKTSDIHSSVYINDRLLTEGISDSTRNKIISLLTEDFKNCTAIKKISLFIKR
jgi:molybdopterin-guanine dinucleotide biosynthesis protein MobB